MPLTFWLHSTASPSPNRIDTKTTTTVKITVLRSDA